MNLVQHIRKGQKRKLIKTDNIITKDDEPKYRITSRGKPVGIMVACAMEDSGKGIIGISFTRFHLKKEPVWTDDGLNIAFERANKYFNDDYPPKFVLKEHPKYVRKQFLKFAERAERYFKDCTLPPWFKYYVDTGKYFFPKRIRRQPEECEQFISGSHNEEVKEYIEECHNVHQHIEEL